MRLDQLEQKYRLEKEKYEHYLTEPVVIQPAAVFQALAVLPFSNSAVELVPDNVLKVTLVLPQDLMLMLSMPTHEKGQAPVFSLFRDSEALVIDQRPLEKIIQGVQQVLREY